MLILIRGAGDLASGVALRLQRAGLRVIMTELPQPLAVRRLVSFSEAVLAGECSVEGVAARRVDDPSDSLRVLQVLSKGKIPVLVDPEGISVKALHPGIVVDARMLKLRVPLEPVRVGLLVGLGPGFIAGENCHAVVETNRGHHLGRVFWQGAAEEDTGLPDGVADRRAERVLRAPVGGRLQTAANLGDLLHVGQAVARIVPNDESSPAVELKAQFNGALRGLLPDGYSIQPGMKIGDLDPRGQPQYCSQVSDKALAIGGGVLEAILSKAELRRQLWS